MSKHDRTNEIREFILANVAEHPSDISTFTAAHFGITTQAVAYHLGILEKEHFLASSGVRRGKRYALGQFREKGMEFPILKDLHEDVIWQKYFSFIVDGIPENIADICYYGFTEMVNNVVDHSEGKTVHISVLRDLDYIYMVIEDDGEGIFKRITRKMNLVDERQALFELSKGKLTTDPNNHSGEGVFFTSRAFDLFSILSGDLQFGHDDDIDILGDRDYLKDMGHSKGTTVYMRIAINSNKDLQKVFDEYTAGPDEFEFNKTVIPIKLAAFGSQKLISRSQAKRLLMRVDRFAHVVLDFEGVSMIGQAFADEIFRVYANKHPDVILQPRNAGGQVLKMIARARAGDAG